MDAQDAHCLWHTPRFLRLESPLGSRIQKSQKLRQIFPPPLLKGSGSFIEKFQISAALFPAVHGSKHRLHMGPGVNLLQEPGQILQPGSLAEGLDQVQECSRLCISCLPCPGQGLKQRALRAGRPDAPQVIRRKSEHRAGQNRLQRNVLERIVQNLEK